MSRRLIDMTEADLEALLDQRLAAVLVDAPSAAAPALVDRTGLAKALSCSVKTLDRLRALPGFPELVLVDSPRFDVADVVAFLKGQSAAPGLRVVGGRP